MTTGATGQLGLALPVQGELSGTWGDTVNNGITQYTNIAIAGTLTLTGDGAVTLANTTGDASASNITSTLTGAGTVTAQFAIVRVTGTLTVAKVVTGPSYSKTYTVVNAATGGIVTFKASGQTGVSVAVGESAFVYFNGTDYVKLVGTATAGAAGGSNTQVQFNSSGILSGSSGLTWDGTTLSSTQVNITGQGTLRLQDTTGGEYVGLRSPGTLGASYTLTFPADDGTSGQALITDGSGVLSWSTAASGDVYGPGSSTDNAVARFDSTTGKLLQNSVVIIGDTGDVSGVGTLSATTLTLTNALGTAYGGTGLTSFTSGGVVYASSTSALATGSALTFDGTILKVSGSANEMLRLDTSSTAYDAAIRIFQAGVQKANIQAGVGTTGGGLDIFSSGSTPIVFGNSSELMRLTSTGLGIGTSSPVGKVDVQQSTTDMVGLSILNTNGAVGTTTSSQVRLGISNSAGVSYAVIKAQEASADDYPALTFGVQNAVTTTPTERMRITSAGFVGIGTSSPSYQLNVQGASDTYAGITAGDSSVAGLLLGKDSNKSLGRVSYDNSDNSLQLWTNGSEKARITSGGNVGIGTSSPASKMEIVPTADSFFTGGLRVSRYSGGNLQYGTITNNGGLIITAVEAAVGTPFTAFRTSADGSTSTEQMRLNTTGLGIGTSSPAGKLDITSASGGYANIYLTQTGVKTWAIENTATSGLFKIIEAGVSDRLILDGVGNASLSGTTIPPNTVYPGLFLAYTTNIIPVGGAGSLCYNVYTVGTQLKWQQSGFGGSQFVFGNGEFSWAGNNTAGTANANATLTEFMRLNASGNLGIGTSSPTTLVDLARSSTSGSDATMPNMFVRNTSATQGNGASTFNQAIALVSAGNGTVIGGLRAAYDSAGPYGTGMQLFVNSTNPLQFFTNGSERARIDSSGNMGLGTTTMTRNFNIGGSNAGVGLTLNNTGTSGRSFSIFSTNSSASVVGALGVYDDTASAYRMVIDSSGNFLVGKIANDVTASGTQLESTGTVAITRDSAVTLICNRKTNDGTIVSIRRDNTEVGSISATTTLTSYNVTSDYRLKNTVAPMTGALAKVALLKPCTYKWNVNGSDGEGFIAHELAEVVPHAVTGAKDAVDEDGKPVHQGIDVSFLVATLTAAMQEQQAIIESLKARLDAANL